MFQPNLLVMVKNTLVGSLHPKYQLIYETSFLINLVEEVLVIKKDPEKTIGCSFTFEMKTSMDHNLWWTECFGFCSRIMVIVAKDETVVTMVTLG